MPQNSLRSSPQLNNPLSYSTMTFVENYSSSVSASLSRYRVFLSQTYFASSAACLDLTAHIGVPGESV
jgi:hypothetical protein